MKKKLALIIVTIITMLVLVISASYAYFSVVRVSANITFGNFSNITFNISPPVNYNIVINPYYPVNESIIYDAGTSTGKTVSVEVGLDSSGYIRCGYDIYYMPDSDTDVFVPSPDNIYGLPELVLVIYSTNYYGSTEILQFDLSNKSYISESEGYKISEDWAVLDIAPAVVGFDYTLSYRYYNYDFEQSINANKNIKGRIVYKPKSCSTDRYSVAKYVVKNNVNSSNTDGSGNPWTIKSEGTDGIYGIRYEGKDPNNYICFKETCASGDLFRIVGLVDDVAREGSTYYTDDLLKIVKNTYSNRGALGSTGDWTVSTARSTLNSTFLTNAYISDIADKILETKWYLMSPTSSTITPAQFYEYERNGSQYNASLPKYSFDKVGLIYASDFLYGSYETGSCNHANVYNATYASNCKDSNYLQKAQNYYCISPSPSYSNRIRYIKSDGTTTTVAVSNNYYWYPTFHLRSNVFLSGSGTASDPYKIVE